MAVYEPRSSTPLFKAVPMRAVVWRPSVLDCDQGAEMRRLATSSPGTSLSFSPVVSSVLSISYNAVASQSSSVRPDALWNPRTATDLRTGIAVAVAGAFETRFDRYRKPYHPMPASRTTPSIAP
jgi:hypothetical protein